MPLLSPQHPIIRVPLTDRHFNDTVIKQEATFVTLRHEQHPETGVGTANITVLVKSYATDNGTQGIYLGDKGLADKRVDLVADNNTLVNAQTGAILAIRTTPFDTPEWLATVETFAATDTMLQGDFFLALRESAPVIIGDMIRQHIAHADAMGKFA